MKALFEKIVLPPDSSWRYFQRDQEDSLPFNWHYHPEYELALVRHARGCRYVGDHIGQVDGEELILLGPNLPHTWALEGVGQAIDVRVLWFGDGWLRQLVQVCPELAALPGAMQRAAAGIKFGPAVRKQVVPLMLAMAGQDAITRLLSLLQVLQHLAMASGDSLSVALHGQVAGGRAEQRMSRVTAYLAEHYHQPIDMPRLAALASLSVNSLCRAFRQHARMTISDYVHQLRIGRACAELISGEAPIATIAHRVGFGHVGQFNRLFRRHKQMTPREFRERFRRS